MNNNALQEAYLTEQDFGDLIEKHIAKMFGGLEMASLQNFIETGKITGSFRLRLISMLQFAEWRIINYQQQQVSPVWVKVDENTKPIGIVLGFNKEWIDEDYNPSGICECFLMDEGYWMVSKWCGIHDEWHTRETGQENWDKDKYENPLPAPTLYTFLPKLDESKVLSDEDWISIDTPPTENAFYLIYPYHGAGGVFTAAWEDDHFEVWVDKPAIGVTHYMPLPKPPQPKGYKAAKGMTR